MYVWICRVSTSTARTIFNRMRTEVMAGQYLDLLEEAVGPDQTPAVAEDRALNILRFKSAKYSMERPLMLGGALAGADDALAERPLAELMPIYHPGTEQVAAGLTGTAPAFSNEKARRLLGWRPQHNWRDELAAVSEGVR